MATQSSILAWRIPWTEEPGVLQFIGLYRVRHDRSNLACMHRSVEEKQTFRISISMFMQSWKLCLFDIAYTNNKWENLAQQNDNLN